MSVSAIMHSPGSADQIAEDKQCDGSQLEACDRLGSPRQCLRVNILSDLRQFAILNGNVEDPIIHKCPIRRFDSPNSGADDHDSIALCDEFRRLWV